MRAKADGGRVMSAAMAYEIDVLQEAGAWHRVPGAESRAAAAVEAALAATLPDVAPGLGRASVCVVLSDDAAVRDLNRDWRGKDKPTNVLSFPVDPPVETPADMPPPMLGDIVLAFETVLAEATEQQKQPLDHLTHLVVHGTLHLLGFDHEIEAEAEDMEAREAAILAGFGIANPYLEHVMDGDERKFP